MREHQAKLWTVVDATSLLAAGDALEDWMQALRGAPRVVPAETCKQLLQLALRRNVLAMHCGVLRKPKHHLFIEMTLSIPYKGNPRFYQCYFDEGPNDAVAKIAATCRRHTFEKRLFAKFHRWQKQHLLPAMQRW